MQQVTRRTLSEGVALTCVTTPRFKRSVLRAVLLLPLGGENAALRACLPQVLRRGTAEYTNLNALGAALDELYGARIESAVRKEGENLCIGFLADCIDEVCVPDADGLTARLSACSRACSPNRISPAAAFPPITLRARKTRSATGLPPYGTTRARGRCAA